MSRSSKDEIKPTIIPSIERFTNVIERLYKNGKTLSRKERRRYENFA